MAGGEGIAHFEHDGDRLDCPTKQACRSSKRCSTIWCVVQVQKRNNLYNFIINLKGQAHSFLQWRADLRVCWNLFDSVEAFHVIKQIQACRMQRFEMDKVCSYCTFMHMRELYNALYRPLYYSTLHMSFYISEGT